MSGIYWFVLFFVIVCGVLCENNPKVCLYPNGSYTIKPNPGVTAALFLVLAGISGLRYRVGTDYMAYYQWPNYSWNEVWNYLITYKEGGFSLLAKLLQTVWPDGQSLIFGAAVVTIGLYIWTIYRSSPTFLLSILFFVLLGQWQGSFNGIRQYIAAAILFFGYNYILNRQFIKYTLIVFLASMFHKSAIVMILPCFLFLRKPDLKQIIILTSGSVILLLSYDAIFSIIGKTKGIIMLIEDSEYRSTEVNPFRIIISFIPVVIYLVLCDKEKHTRAQDFYVNAIYFNAFAMLAGMGSAYLARIGIYTNSFLILGYGYLFQMIRDERSKRITIFVVLLIYLVFWLYSIQAGGISHFRWFFDR